MDPFTLTEMEVYTYHTPTAEAHTCRVTVVARITNWRMRVVAQNVNPCHIDLELKVERMRMAETTRIPNGYNSSNVFFDRLEKQMGMTERL